MRTLLSADSLISACFFQGGLGGRRIAHQTEKVSGGWNVRKYLPHWRLPAILGVAGELPADITPCLCLNQSSTTLGSRLRSNMAVSASVPPPLPLGLDLKEHRIGGPNIVSRAKD